MPRVLHVTACLAVFALFVQAQAPLVKRPVSPLIGVYLDFDHVPENVPVDVMKRAVERLLKPSGITLAWRLTRENQGVESFSGLAVLKFKGRCDAESPIPGPNFGTLGEVDALALTAVSHGE